MLTLIAALSGCSASPRFTLHANGGKTRNEVLADYAMWQKAGMAKFFRGNQPYAFFSPAYKTAQARYRALRNGPEYTAELERLNAPRKIDKH